MRRLNEPSHLDLCCLQKKKNNKKTVTMPVAMKELIHLCLVSLKRDKLSKSYNLDQNTASDQGLQCLHIIGKFL